MKQLLSILFLFAVISVHAQDGSFNLKLNGKQIAKGPFAAEAGITVSITQKQLQPGGKLQVVIKDAGNNSGWKRILLLTDTEGNEVKTMEKNMSNGTFDWNIRDLKDLLKKYKTLTLHTYSIPIDEQQAALVRVRRFQLCTLELK
jgi:hypothetical protein